jgi:integrase
MECVRLRMNDVEFERREALVHDGKGGKDRVTMLSENLIAPDAPPDCWPYRYRRCAHRFAGRSSRRRSRCDRSIACGGNSYATRPNQCWVADFTYMAT